MDDLDSSLHLLPPSLPAGNDKKPRRRTRDVNSRYMSTPTHPSPATAYPSSSPIISVGGDHINHLASSPRVRCVPPPPSLLADAKRHHRNPKPRPIPPSSLDADAATDSELGTTSFRCRYGDENIPPVSGARRSLDTPLAMGTLQGRTPHTKRRAVVRLFSDNSEKHNQQHLREQLFDQPPNPRTIADPRRKPRQGTPMVSANTINDISTPRWTSVRRSLLKSDHQPAAVAPPTAAARRTNPRPPTPARQNLFPSEVDDIGNSGNGLDEDFSDAASSVVDFSDSETCSVSSQGGLCDSPPLPGASTRAARSANDLRSSMPEADHLPSSARRTADGNPGRPETAGDHSSPSCRASTDSLCYRSLNSSLSSSQQQAVNLMNKYVNRTFVSLKPPQHPSTKQGLETRKGKKASSSQEVVHMLRLLDNNYVQWRFINAKARATADARRIAAQRSLHGIQSRISGLQGSVEQKKIGLQQLQRRERLSSNLECQIPYLEEWATHEEKYSSSLSELTKALQDASIRLPINGNLRVDAGEIKDVLNCGVLLLHSLSPCVGRFLSNAESIEDEVSELAKLVSSERTLVEQCGNLLSEAHMLQVKECSLRSQLMQLKQGQSTYSESCSSKKPTN